MGVALLPAQVFVVDAANGPGTNYTSIAAAVAAVPDGAVLLVRAGLYGEFTIGDQSLAVLGGPGVVVSDVLGAPIRIDGLSSGKAVTLYGLDWSSYSGPSRLQCTNCAGRIMVESCRANLAVSSAGGRIELTDCARVGLRASSLEGGGIMYSCVEAVRSNLLVEDSWLRGYRAAIELSLSQVQVVNCQLECWGGFFAAYPVWMHGGELRVSGATSIVLTSTASVFAIGGGNGRAVIDPTTSLQNVASPPFSPQIAVQMRSIPRLIAGTQPLGGSASATLSIPAGAAGALAAGFPGVPFPVAGLADPVWLDTGAALRAIGAAPALTSAYAVPNATFVLGVQITWQGAVLNAGSVALSNPTTYSHR